MFSGSYRPEDVHILLKPVTIAPISIAEKERLIQSGQRHYSELINRESLPSAQYLQIFEAALQRNQQKLARDFLCLAELISQSRTGDITLVSLARAGTPVGVILKHILEKRLGRRVSHYSVSIIRDRGIDINALAYILSQAADTSIVFVDGWTAKGVISHELETSITSFNALNGCAVSPALYVLSDIAGTAAVAASTDDYLIPSGILNSTISGLISRSILNSDYIGPEDFHGCLYYREFEPYDISVRFVETMLAVTHGLPGCSGSCHDNAGSARQQRRRLAHCFIQEVMRRFDIADENRIKPGIGEASRVLLRRLPERLLLRNRNDADVRHLILLAEEKQVPVIEDSSLPYRAVSLIKKVDHD